ncbi:MAG: hypothetical protein AAF594_17755 [Bacteroidota bacterium]
MGRVLPVLLAVALAACGDRAPAPEAEPTSPVDTASVEAPPTPFDDALEVEPAEPPEQVVEITPRPEPTPPPPEPIPEPAPELEASGSCDVRETEGFCFAYTGDGWTPDAAETHCAEAPDSAYLGAACPLLGRIATCTFVRPDDATLEVVYTYYEPYDPALAELACPGDFERL